MRPIDADRLLKTIADLDVECADQKQASIMLNTIRNLFPMIVNDEPTVDTERPLAKIVPSNWTIKAPLEFDGKCSNCNSPVFDTDKYCIECGTKLIKGR